MKPHSLNFIAIFFLTASSLVAQKFELNYLNLKNDITYTQITRNDDEFFLKSTNCPDINIFHGHSGTKITIKSQSYSVENYNHTTETIKNMKGEYIGLKQKFNDYHLIGFNNEIFKVSNIKLNAYRIELAEPTNQPVTKLTRNIIIKTKGKTIQLTTSLEKIPAELIPPIILVKFKNNPVDLSYYQDKHSPLASKIAISAISILVGIVLLINQ